MHLRSIAIITARGGSKRIPRKNVRDFCGKPVIAYSLEAAASSGCFDVVMVSTDDEEIAGVAKSLGAEVPFMRSRHTSGDYSTTAEVLLEVLEDFAAIGQRFDLACCIYPTAPFVSAEVLREAHSLLKSDAALDGVLPVARFSHPIQRALRVGPGDGLARFYHPEHALARSQDLEPAFRDAGQFYWLRVERFLESKRVIGEATAAIERPEALVQDIDTDQDWEIAEMKFRAAGLGGPPDQTVAPRTHS